MTTPSIPNNDTPTFSRRTPNPQPTPESAPISSPNSHPSHSSPAPNTYPTSQPLSIIPRPALPDENPTPADTILEAIIFENEAEKNRAHNTVNAHLDELNAEQLPFTPHLQASLRSVAFTQMIATRVGNATRPQEDKKAPPAALYTAAIRADTAQTNALTTYLDLYQKHRQQHLQERIDKQQQQENEEDENNRRAEGYLHDLRIPIFGLPRHKYQRRLDALAKQLKYLDDTNHYFMSAGQEKQFTLPFIPTSLYPKFDPTLPAPTHPPIPDNPEHEIRPYTLSEAPCDGYPIPDPELFTKDPQELIQNAQKEFPSQDQTDAPAPNAHSLP